MIIMEMELHHLSGCWIGRLNSEVTAMTVEELIEQLSQCQPEAEVIFINSDGEEEPINGIAMQNKDERKVYL